MNRQNCGGSLAALARKVTVIDKVLCDKPMKSISKANTSLFDSVMLLPQWRVYYGRGGTLTLHNPVTMGIYTLLLTL